MGLHIIYAQYHESLPHLFGVWYNNDDGGFRAVISDIYARFCIPTPEESI